MKKAVIFDLYETLVTEWDSEKYTSSRCAAELGLDHARFREIWEAQHSAMNTGAVSCEEVWRQICRETGVACDEEKIAACLAKRIAAKAQCFARPHEDILAMLREIRGMGLRLALCSNGSPEEITALPHSALYACFDAVIVSCEVHLQKPQAEIYQLCADRLGVHPSDCLFIGDGGSRELYGAAETGMEPLRAMWFLRGEIRPMPFKELRCPREAAEICRSLIEKG